MRKYEITHDSVNTENYSKRITSLVVEPDTKNEDTGAMLFTHGWGNNRFQNLEQMEYAAEKFNLVCAAVEYRGSGYDFDARTGLGWARPYDFSFYQVFDVLNGLRRLLDVMPLNRNRLFHYGTSQGGHIALLSSIFAPETFAAVYATSPVIWPDAKTRGWAGRDFSDDELCVRDVPRHAGMIMTDLFLEHGTNDDAIPHSDHTARLEKRLRELGKEFTVKYHETGGHALSPATTRMEAFKDMMADTLESTTLKGCDDFAAASVVKMKCHSKTLVINWAEPPESVGLFRWE